MSMLFADTLKKLRTDKRLSQHTLAEKMYVTKSAVSRWESVRRPPDAAMISRLSEVPEVCRSLIEINPQINVVYLTAYQEYSFDGWSTGARGFMLNPLTAEGGREQLSSLRYPLRTGGEGV